MYNNDDNNNNYLNWCRNTIRCFSPELIKNTGNMLVSGSKQAARFLGTYKINRISSAGSAGAILLGQLYTCLIAAGLLPCINGKVSTEDHFREIFIATCLGLAVINAPIALNQYQRLLNSTAQLGDRQADKTLFFDKFIEKYPCFANYSTIIQVVMMMLNGVCVFETLKLTYHPQLDISDCLIEVWRGNMAEKIGLSAVGAVAGLALGGPQMAKNMKKSLPAIYGPFLTAFAYSLYILLIGMLPIIINIIRDGTKAYAWSQTSFFMIYALIMPWFRTLFYETLNLKPGQTAFFKKSRLAIAVSQFFIILLPVIAGFTTYHSMYAMLEQFGVSNRTALDVVSIFSGISDGIVQTERAVTILAGLLKELSDYVTIEEAESEDDVMITVDPNPANQASYLNQGSSNI